MKNIKRRLKKSGFREQNILTPKNAHYIYIIRINLHMEGKNGFKDFFTRK